MFIQKAKIALKKYFGYERFRPMQESILESVFSGKDTLVLMPTGGGKSICYQLPALVLEGTCLVISPLIALMRDQVEGLRANGIRAAYLNSSLDSRGQMQVENDFFQGNLDLLYVSPEKLLSQGFFPLLRNAKINLFAIDEAHCISAWGHDFRPEYTQLRLLKDQFPEVPVIALTATADKITRKDIADQLRLREPETFVASFDRPNLTLQVRPGQNRFPQILHFLRAHPKQSGIIYCLSRKTTEMLAEKLKNLDINAAAYHAGLSTAERNRVQREFTNDNVPIICATIAFGMGIDKSNVRWIIHYNLPKNIEGYYQEIGRAGRDGAKAEAILFYSYSDVSLLRDIIQGSPSDQTDLQLSKLERIQQYAEALVCRRRILLGYFGENPAQNCGNCDVCQNPPQQFEGTEIAQKALSAIFRLQQNVGMGMAIDVLRGSGKKELREKGYDQIKTFGAGRDISQWDWHQYLLQLINLGYLEIAYDQGNALKLTALSQQVLFGKQPVQLVKAASLKERAEAEKIKQKARSKVEQHRDELFELLRQVRKALAQELGLPPYIIFNDATLEAMAMEKPLSAKSLLQIPGVGEKKLAEFGEQFLETIRNYVDEHSASIRGTTQQISLELFREGMSLDAIAERRGLTTGTVATHLAMLYEKGEDLPMETLVPAKGLKDIASALRYIPEPPTMKAIFEYFDGQYTYDQIRLALAHHKRKHR